jgi:ankyrin repeat protein
MDLTGALTLARYGVAEALLAQDPARLGAEGRDTIALHLAVDRGDAAAVRWLLEHGVDVDARRVLYDCNHTALHMCAERGLADIATLLLASGAATTILDDKYQTDALGWAEYCNQPAVANLIRAHRAAVGGVGAG